MISAQSKDAVYDSIGAHNFIALLPELKKKGSRYVCKSPFTSEKTPSFNVFANGTRFKCFSSGQGGSLVELLMQLKQLSYVEALEWIAAENNVLIVREKDVDTALLHSESTARAALAEALSIYQTELLRQNEHHPAMQAIHHRELSPQELEAWGLGFAPDGWDWLSQRLMEKYGFDTLVNAGLVMKAKTGNTIDLFRNRLIFPIYDHNGALVSLAGRAIAADEKVKYINGPGTILYNKSAVLFGLNYAKKQIAKTQNAYLCEGYFDVVALHRAKHTNAIATCGTGLSPDQIQSLRRFTPRITLLRDTDAPGIAAAKRDMLLLLANGFEVHICCLPEGKDPDEFVRSQKAEIVETVQA